MREVGSLLFFFFFFFVISSISNEDAILFYFLTKRSIPSIDYYQLSHLNYIHV